MTTFVLDPDYKAFIQRYLDASALSTATSVAQQRLDYEAMVRQFTHPRPAGVHTEDSLAEGRHGPVPLRRYRFRQGNDGALILFLHGGGFILGSLDSHDDICAELCAATGCDLVSVDYRLSPEFRHPVHLDDVEDAFHACDQGNTILLGVSAGGTLAAALSHRLRNQARRASGQVLVYPSLGGDQFDLASYADNAEAPLLSTADIRFYRGVRCGDQQPPLDDPEFYPLVAADFGTCPATVAISADIDPLRDDADYYVRQLRAAGVEARWINEPGLTHDYLRARHQSVRAGQAFDRICDATRGLA